VPRPFQGVPSSQDAGIETSLSCSLALYVSHPGLLGYLIPTERVQDAFDARILAHTPSPNSAQIRQSRLGFHANVPRPYYGIPSWQDAGCLARLRSDDKKDFIRASLNDKFSGSMKITDPERMGAGCGNRNRGALTRRSAFASL
jgi:hypothetical protein